MSEHDDFKPLVEELKAPEVLKELPPGVADKLTKHEAWLFWSLSNLEHGQKWNVEKIILAYNHLQTFESLSHKLFRLNKQIDTRMTQFENVNTAQLENWKTGIAAIAELEKQMKEFDRWKTMLSVRWGILIFLVTTLTSALFAALFKALVDHLFLKK